ncbi:hypothetical protein Tco_0438306 [Tanacetum coccineum]
MIKPSQLIPLENDNNPRVLPILLTTRRFRYSPRELKNLCTIDYRLTYTGYPSVLEGYTDASWISNIEDNSSTSGWVFLLGGGAITWASKKQTCITGSTLESEFVALAAVGKEAEWLKNLLLEIPLWCKPIAPISIRCDSAATLAKAYSQMYNGKSRHLGVRNSMIRELITNGVISIEFVSMSVVYVLTTPISEDGGDDATVEQIRKRAKWDNDDYVCRGLILKGMSNPLFDIYQNIES